MIQYIKYIQQIYIDENGDQYLLVFINQEYVYSKILNPLMESTHCLLHTFPPSYKVVEPWYRGHHVWLQGPGTQIYHPGP